ncbi:endospore germination permease [Halanaerocella petrolearia]
MFQISKGQLAVLLINILIPTAHIQVLFIAIRYAKQDAWLATTIGYLVALVITFISLQLIKLYPDQNILEFSSDIMGSFLGKIVALVFFLYSFLVVVYVLEQFQLLMTIMVYQEFPPFFFKLAMISLVVYAVNLGAEVIFRVSDIIFITVILVTVFVGFGLVTEIDFSRVFPLLEEDMTSILQGSLMPIVFLGQVVIILFFGNLTDKSFKLSKTINIGLFVGFQLIIGFVIASISIYGVDLSSRFLFPPYMLTRFIEAGGMILRQEIFLLVIWIGLILIQATAFFWICRASLVSLFNLNHKNHFSIPLAILIIVLSHISFKGIVDFQIYVETTYSLIIASVQLLVPSLLYLVALIKGKGGS